MPVVITATPTVNVLGRTANHFGVGEIVTLTATLVPAAAAAGAAAPAAHTPVWRWEVTSGADRGHFSSRGNQARLILTSLSGGTMTVRVKDAWDDAQATLELTVVAPSGWSMGPIQYRHHVAGAAHAAFRAAVQVRNAHNVSFDNLELREGNALPVRTGRYVTANANNHHAATFGLAANWINIGAARGNALLQAAASAGHVALAIDRVGSHGWGPPFTENGSFCWRIPWTYRLSIPAAQRLDVAGAAVRLPDSGNRQATNVVTHQETLTGNQMVISKGGQTLTYTATDLAVGTRAAWSA